MTVPPAARYQGMFQIQALCQGPNNETMCPQAELNANVSQWPALAVGETAILLHPLPL